MNALTLTFAGTVLADGVTSQLMGPFSSELQHDIQDGTPIGAAVRTWFDRLRMSEDVTFTVRRQNTKMSRALWQLLLGIRGLPGVSTLVLQLTEGATLHVYTCTGVGKPTIRETQSAGPTLTIAYTFHADNWSYTTTAADDYAGNDIDGSADVDTQVLDGGAAGDVVMLPEIDGSLTA